jgi:CheY-like chemotaxis protein
MNITSPLAQRVYEALLGRYVAIRPGSELPTLAELAVEFYVAPMTILQVLARLEDEGCIMREQDRGTFAPERVVPKVLIVDDEAATRKLVVSQVTQLGFRALEADSRATGLAALEHEPNLALIVSDVSMPDREEGFEFILAARQGWPRIPLAAITGYPDDLASLHGTPYSPSLILKKPIWAGDLEDVLRLALPRTPRKPATMPPPYISSDVNVMAGNTGGDSI